jgi:hypothetical protein
MHRIFDTIVRVDREIGGICIFVTSEAQAGRNGRANHCPGRGFPCVLPLVGAGGDGGQSPFLLPCCAYGPQFFESGLVYEPMPSPSYAAST